jgi:uncharacterized membrane protein YeaQ/YmgE (transglycosylase-associated protein family)
MSLVDLLVLLAIAGICGAIGQAISGVSGKGCLVSIGVGLVGALLGLWIARSLSLPLLFSIQIGGTAFPVVWAIAGSALFVAVISFLTRGRDRE